MTSLISLNLKPNCRRMKMVDERLHKLYEMKAKKHITLQQAKWRIVIRVNHELSNFHCYNNTLIINTLIGNKSHHFQETYFQLICL